MYLNRAQKYVLETLGEYGALKQSQLEIMARYEVYEYLSNLNGYLKQLRQEQKIDVLPCGKQDAYICLPDVEPDEDLIAAFDVVTALRERIQTHRKGKGMVQIRFDFETDKNRIHDAYVLVVRPDMETETAAYADKHFRDDFQTVFFLCYRRTQMKKITSLCNHIFAVNVKGETLFFKNT